MANHHGNNNRRPADQSESQIWYESKELIDLSELADKSTYDGLFELNLSQQPVASATWWGERTIEGRTMQGETASASNNILVAKKFKPNERLNDPEVFSSKTRDDQVVVFRDQLACAILRLRDKSDLLDRRLGILEAQLDSMETELISRLERLRTQTDRVDANSWRGETANKLFWFGWPIVMLLILGRFCWLSTNAA